MVQVVVVAPSRGFRGATLGLGFPSTVSVSVVQLHTHYMAKDQTGSVVEHVSGGDLGCGPGNWDLIASMMRVLFLCRAHS